MPTNDNDVTAATNRRLRELSLEINPAAELDVAPDLDPSNSNQQIRTSFTAPEWLSHFGLGMPQLSLLALIAAAVIAIAGYFSLRAQAEVVPTFTASTPMMSASPVPEKQVVVDVVGKVRRPGLVKLPAGSRVADALQKAGLRPGVSLASLNQARILIDGEQIVVGNPVPGKMASAGTTGSASGLVSLNTADQATLETLPGVGPVTAEKILAWRTQNGGFTNIEQLQEVAGIGPKTFAEISPHVTL